MKKFCTRCEENKDTGEFQKDKSRADGLNFYCKACNKAKQEERYWANRETVLGKAAEYRKNNREAIKQRNKDQYRKNIAARLRYRKQYDQDHAEEVKAAKANYYARNGETIRQKRVDYRRKNFETCKINDNLYHGRPEVRSRINAKTRELRVQHPELYEKKIRSYQRTWKAKNPGKRNDYNAKRRATTQGVEAENVSRKDVLKRDKNCCRYCATPLTIKTVHIDHLTPLCRQGKHVLANCGASCQTCNLRKGKKTETEFRRVLLREATACL